MKLQVLIATMNCPDPARLAEAIGVDDYVIINQITEDIDTPNDKIRSGSTIVSVRERGLSRSRNRALYYADGDVCVISDDDLRYEADYKELIVAGYKKYPDADIIAFYVDSGDTSSHKPPLKEGRVGFLRSMKIRSVQLTFRRKSLLSHGIRFDEEFGAGTHNYMGEENILLADCIAAGLKVYSVPVRIATLLESESTWFTGYTKRYFEIKGKVFYRMSPMLSALLVMQFVVRKIQTYRKDTAFHEALLYAYRGLRDARLRKNLYFLGDFSSNTGPANVNKSYAHYLRNDVIYCKSNNKAVRVMHFMLKLLFVKGVVVSGSSKFHLLIIVLCRRLNKPTFYLMHGYHAVEDKLNEVDNPEAIKLESDILNLCSTIVCVSESFAKMLAQEKVYLSEKITFVNNGVDGADIPPKKHRVADPYKIISVGGGVPLKRNLDVCKAIDNLKDDSVEYTVIGAYGRDGAKIKKYPFVKYYESVSHEEVLLMMRQSDLYVQNSAFETFGLAVCEALSQGCDLLVRDTVGAIGVIEGLGDEQILNHSSDQELTNKIKALMSNRDASTGLRFKSGSDWKSSSEKLLGIISND